VTKDGRSAKSASKQKNKKNNGSLHRTHTSASQKKKEEKNRWASAKKPKDKLAKKEGQPHQTQKEIEEKGPLHFCHEKKKTTATIELRKSIVGKFRGSVQRLSDGRFSSRNFPNIKEGKRKKEWGTQEWLSSLLNWRWVKKLSPT